MKRTQFDNVTGYVGELIALFPKAMEKNVGLRASSSVLFVARETIEVITEAVSEIEHDGKEIDLICDDLDDQDYQIPGDAAIEVVRRLRAIRELARAEAEARAMNMSTLDSLLDALEDLLFSNEIRLYNQLALAELFRDLYDRWADVDMGKYDHVLCMVLQAGCAACESVTDAMMERQEDSDSEPDYEAADLLKEAANLANDFQVRVEAFLKRHPDLEGCFVSNEDREDD